MIEGSWEVTTRLLWAIVLSMLALVAAFALCGILFEAALLLNWRHSESFALFCSAVGLMAFALAAVLFAVATRYPTEDDHDIKLSVSGGFMVMRVLQSAAFANLIRWIFSPALRILLVSSGELFPPVAVTIVFWLSWTAALVAVNGGCTRTASVVTGLAVAFGAMFLCTVAPTHCVLLSWVLEGGLGLCVLIAFYWGRQRRFGSELAS